MFGAMFSQRNLKSNNETITIYNDMAILEFYWVFDVTFAGEKPTPLQTNMMALIVVEQMTTQY